MDEIKYVTDRFKAEPLLLEVQVWEPKTAAYFADKGYSVFNSSDGSFWITDESRYLD